MSNARLHTERGFTLLLASLISSVVLSIGSSIFALAQKEITISSLGRDSQFAFYAADTGAECALYWDIRYQYFQAGAAPPGVSPTCDNQAINASGRQPTLPQTMTFQFEPNGYCAQVRVEKSVSPVTGGVATIVHSDGFSTNCASISTSARSLQRAVELDY